MLHFADGKKLHHYMFSLTFRDTIIVTTIDTFTSLLAGCTTFSILGNLQYESGIKDIKDVVNGGLALAFVSYPNAIAKLDLIPQVSNQSTIITCYVGI